MIQPKDCPLGLGIMMRLNRCCLLANRWIRGTVVLKQSMRGLTTVRFAFQTPRLDLA